MTIEAKPEDIARLQRLQGFLASDPDNLVLRNDTLRTAMAVGAWDVARECVATGLLKHPGNAELLAHDGFCALQAQDYAHACDSLHKALALGHSAAGVRYNLGFAQFMSGQYDAALQSLAEDAGLSEQLPLTHVLRARCLHHLGELDAAVDELKPLLDSAAETAEANGLMALLLNDLNRNDEAQEYAQRALALNPEQLDALLANATIQSEAEQYIEADLSYTALLKRYPDCGRAWSGLGQVSFSRFNFGQALTALEQAVKFMPNHIGTWHLLAWVHIVEGRVAEAKQALNSAYELDRNFGETHGGLAVIAAMEGREADAQAAIKRALRLNPLSMSARFAEMLLLEAAGKPEAMRETFEKVMDRHLPDSALRYRDVVQTHMRKLQSGELGTNKPDNTQNKLVY